MDASQDAVMHVTLVHQVIDPTTFLLISGANYT